MRGMLLVLVLAAPGCNINIFHSGGNFADGLVCGEHGECPPGQKCTGELICRTPCSTAGCETPDCGCDRQNQSAICDVDGFCRAKCNGTPACQSSMGIGGCSSPTVCDSESNVCRLPCAATSCGSGFDCELTSDQCQICRPSAFPIPDGATIIDGGESFDGGFSSDLAAPAGPLLVAAGQQMPQFVAFDGVTSSILWDSSHSILSCSINGCGAGGQALILAISMATAQGLTVAGNWVVWSDANGNVLACPTVGCAGMTPMIVASGQTGVGPVTSDGAFAYWTAGSMLEQCNIEQGCGPSPSPITLTPLAQSITLDGDTLYWSSGHSVLSCPKTGCAGGPQAVTKNQGLAIGPLVTSGGSIYFADGDCISSCPTGSSCTQPTNRCAAARSRIAAICRRASRPIRCRPRASP